MKIKQVMVLLSQEDYNTIMDAATKDERKKSLPAARVSIREWIAFAAVNKANKILAGGD